MSTVKLLIALVLGALFTSPVLAESHGGTGHTAGGVEVMHAWSRAVPVAGMNAAGYMELKNSGDKNITLTAFTTESANSTSLHESVKEGDMVSMQELPDGITIPAGESVKLQPGGLHLMFMGITEPFAEGTEIPVTLLFDSGEEISTKLTVRAIDDMKHDSKSHH